MDYSQIKDFLLTNIPELDISLNHPLSPHTTVKIGGPADLFIHSQNTNQLKSILQLLYQNHVQKPTILGFGSNSLISDTGIRGVVIQNSSSTIDFNNSTSDLTSSYKSISKSNTNHTELDPQKYLNFSSLDYSEDQFPHHLITLDSGISLPFAINQLISHGLTGLQWFAYIPSTIGGAVFSNIHGGSHNFSEFVHSVEIFDYTSGLIKTLKNNDLQWDYDFSSLQQNPQFIILSVTLSLPAGDTSLATNVVKSWISQKQKIQPMNSLGSVFKNPTLDQCQPIFGEQKSAGWIIEHQLGLKGHQIGQAQISTQHANFIVNLGHATATDYLALINLVQSQMQTKFGFQFEPEIKLLGQF